MYGEKLHLYGMTVKAKGLQPLNSQASLPKSVLIKQTELNLYTNKEIHISVF